MNGSDFLPLVSSGIVKGIFGDSPRLLSCDDLESLHHSRYTLMFQSTVLTLGVLTDYYNVNVLMSGEVGRGEGRKEGEEGGKEGGREEER